MSHIISVERAHPPSSPSGPSTTAENSLLSGWFGSGLTPGEAPVLVGSRTIAVWKANAGTTVVRCSLSEILGCSSLGRWGGFHNPHFLRRSHKIGSERERVKDRSLQVFELVLLLSDTRAVGSNHGVRHLVEPVVHYVQSTGREFKILGGLV